MKFGSERSVFMILESYSDHVGTMKTWFIQVLDRRPGRPTSSAVNCRHGVVWILMLVVETVLLFCSLFGKVSAEDKASGKVQQITITSEKGRLSDEEIERMVKESEAFAEQDRQER